MSEAKTSVSRRDFLKGAGVTAAGAAALGLAGCSGPAVSGSGAGGQASGGASGAGNGALVDLETAVGPERRATATLENAAPIPPVEPPASWDGEADIVIVGAGGGGIAGALLAAEQGASVIVLEKATEAGGATQHANGWLNISGTGAAQQEMGFSVPEGNVPFDRTEFVKAMQNTYQYSIDNELISNLGQKGGEVADWMTEHGADWICAGAFYIPSGGLVSGILGQKQLTDQFSQLSIDAGADYHFSTEVTALVQDGGRIVGVQARENGAETYYRAEKGVVLCAGGFGMNPDLVKKYIPSAYDAIVYGGPFPNHSGEALRMALGVGADTAGFDSWSCWECAPDNGTGAWNFFYGFRQIMQMPWLNFDREGKRVDFYDARLDNMPGFIGGLGDTLRVAVQMSRPGHRAYAIFDSNYEEYIDKIKADMGERKPITKEDPQNYETDLFDTDWRVEFQNALDDGRLKKADTLDELAEMLGLDTAIVNNVVDRWNASCEKGVDDDPYLIYPYLPEWLNPIKEGPFYGAVLGGQLGKTMAGVRVNKDLQVMDTQGHEIPGLFAGFTTAGGIVGECNYGGGLVNTSILGGCALSWVSGYTAVQTALGA